MKISDEIRKWCETYCGCKIGIGVCDDLRWLADRIDREMVELPKDADGIPIHVWDTVYDRKSGSQMEVRSMSFNGQWHLTTNKGHISNTSLVACEMPDSFERIAEDIEAAEDWRDGDGEYCTGVSSVEESTLHELADRIRRLAKEDER